MNELIKTTENPIKEMIAIRQKIFMLLSSYIPLCIEQEEITRIKELYLEDGYLIKAISNLEKEMVPKEYKKFSDLVNKDITIQDLVKIISIETIHIDLEITNKDDLKKFISKYDETYEKYNICMTKA